MNKQICSAAAAIALVAGTATAAPFVAVNTYDENTAQANTVEGSLTALTAAGMQALVTANPNNAGIINFDNGTLDTASSFSASFAGGIKTLSVSRDDGYSYSVGPQTSRTPISGTQAISTSATVGDILFNFTPISAEEFVTSVGLTVLSRNNSAIAAQREFKVIATLDDASTLVAPASGWASFGGGNALNDQFVGFTAPAGRYITAVKLDINDNGGFTSVDDLAFVTGQVPEPASLALVGLGGLVLLRRSR